MFPYKNNLLKKSVNFTFFEISSKFDVRFYWLHFHFKNLKMSSCWDARLFEISICNCESNTAMQLCYFPVYHANETFPIFCSLWENIYIYLSSYWYSNKETTTFQLQRISFFHVHLANEQYQLFSINRITKDQFPFLLYIIIFFILVNFMKCPQ